MIITWLTWLIFTFIPVLDPPQTQVLPEKTVSVIGVGDMMLGSHYPSRSYLPPNDGKDLLTAVKPFLQSADVTFGNLEGALLNEGPTTKNCNDPSKCYAFKMPEHYVNYLKESGFDMVSIANNHVGDFGNRGRERTKAKLDKAGIVAAGLLAYPTAIVERNGIKYGLAAFAPNTGTCDIRQIDKAAETVRNLSAQVDIVIVSFHGGAEGSKYQHVPKRTETFYGENRGDVHKFSHAMVDAGADVVFGHGPHVVRAVEVYKDRFIAYSLGNFCTYARFNLRGPNGLAPIIKVFMKPDGTFIEAEVLSAKQEGEGGPYPDKSHEALLKIKELTDQDFPEHGLTFTPPYIRN